MKTIKDKIMLDLGNWFEEEHPNEDMVSKIIDLTKNHVLKLIDEFIDEFAFPKCEKCGACFCVHIKKKFKKELKSKIEEELVKGENEK